MNRHNLRSLEVGFGYIISSMVIQCLTVVYELINADEPSVEVPCNSYSV